MVILSSTIVLASNKFSHYPVEPILRPGSESHTAQIRRISVDRQRRFIVSASTDKTARVWDLQTGHLLRVLRVPQGAGNLGEIYAVALSPDGKNVALAGRTGGAKLGGYAIYIFNRESRQVRHRIGGLPTIVSHLTFSQNGNLLAATFIGTHGVRVFDGKSFTEIAIDNDYGNTSYWADFDIKDRLVTTSYDGLIRLYDVDYTIPEIKKKSPGTKQPYAVAFSPDGRRVALSYRGSNRIDVLSGTTLEPLLRMHENSDKVTHTDSSVVGWSDQGDLYAGGGYSVDGQKVIRRWAESGSGKYDEFKISNSSIIDLAPLANGKFAVAGVYPPTITVLDSEGKVIWNRESMQVNSEGQVNTKSIRISESGTVLAFRFDTSDQQPVYFDMVAGGFVDASSVENRFISAITEGKELKVSNWQDSDEPILNGVRLMLKKNETSRTLAITPNNQQFLIGADWTLRLFDPAGKELDTITTPGAVWSLVVTEDSRMVIAGLGDGTFRWYSIGSNRKLKEILVFFPQRDRRWVAWVPEGYYQASIDGAELVGWHVNRGRDKAGDFFSINSLRKNFYRPGVIVGVLASLDVEKAVSDANQLNRIYMTDPISVSESLPPVISIMNSPQNNNFSSPTVHIQYQVRTRNPSPVTQVKIMLDSRPIPSNYILSGFPERWEEGKTYTLTIFLPPKDVPLSIIAMNEHGPSEAAIINLNWQTPVAPNEPSERVKLVERGDKKLTRAKVDKNVLGHMDLPNLYILAIGTGNYTQTKNLAEELSYPTKDAEDFLSLFLEQQDLGLYNKIYHNLLTNPTTKQIIKGLVWLETHKIEPKDIVIIFLAGHGYTEKREYYFLTIDGRVDDLRTTALDYTQLKRTMTRLNGKVLFFIDTCHASQLMGGGLPLDFAGMANDLKSPENGIIVFTASKKNESSHEDVSWENGVFTEALLEGLKGKAYPHQGKVSFTSLNLYISRRIPELISSAGSTQPQTPGITIPSNMSDFNITVVAH